jgi:RNA ligase (TIGR02306 family)
MRVLRMESVTADSGRRKMASVQRVVWKKPIEGAEKIELIGVLGWQMVALKDEFQVGDLGIFCEIDCQLPEVPEFEFMRPRKFRVKTIRLMKQLSQGLMLPLSNEYVDRKVKEYMQEKGLHEFSLKAGEDVSGILGFVKYEPEVPECLRGIKKGNFPTHIVPKTDELRIQSYPGVLDELRGRTVCITTKMDGSSLTAAMHGGEFILCSRNQWLEEDANSAFWKAAKKYQLEERLRAYMGITGREIAIQAELCAPGIQKNRMELQDVTIYVFNVWFISEHRYANFDEFCEITLELGLPTVPMVDIIKDFNMTVDDLIELSKGKYQGTKNNREGIVFRPYNECFSGVLGGRMSAKCINPEYLLKEDA